MYRIWQLKQITTPQFCSIKTSQATLCISGSSPFHTVRDVKNWIAQKKIKVLRDWPSQSPDLNPIEHLWHELERRLRKRSVHLKNFHELEEALQEEWKRIPSETYINLIESMLRRIEACIKNNGWPTKY